MAYMRAYIHTYTHIQVQVSTTLPSATETVKFSHQMRSTVVKDILLSLKNPAIDKCRSTIMELMGQQVVYACVFENNALSLFFWRV
jgi:hypothetical protein